MTKKNNKSKQDAGVIDLSKQLPVLAARDLVAFPGVMMSLQVGRQSSMRAVEHAAQSTKTIFLVAQKNQDAEEPSSADLYTHGVIANIVQPLKLPDGSYKVLVQGMARAQVLKYVSSGEYLSAHVKLVVSREISKPSPAIKSLMAKVRESLQLLVEREHLPEEMLLVVGEINDPGLLADVILAHYRLDPSKAQSFLEQRDPVKRLRDTYKIVKEDISQFLVSEKIKDQARDEMSKGQREYYLREQIKQIQRELGESESGFDDLSTLRQALDKAKLPAHAKLEADKQYKRLERMHAESSEYALLRTYLEWISDLPWSIRTKDNLGLDRAKLILDQDHFALDKAKDRILEYLSVRKLNPDSKGPILCFVGAPGVGKTSLGRSIAHALERKFFRFSLGGVRDEAEIRGHRRTYVGALPGRIVQGLKQAGSANPVIVLDELDKIGADFRGDPASALLEVLDPQQNKEFVDHYLNVGFDLSEVLFVATANTVDTIPSALLDRLEVIYLAGYTTQEKLNIAKRFLLPRQIQENGLQRAKIVVPDNVLLFIIERYTQEAGVRNLEREIASLCRKLARLYAEHKKLPANITVRTLRELLGVTKLDPEKNESRDLVGVARGLAWTIYGGEVMPIEVSTAKGNGQLQLTGQLGNVMQESAKAALFFARAQAVKLGLDPEFHSKLDIHIHVPGGATPKDGPSAGVTITAALVSALSGRTVSKDFAMTGEITLRGTVLAVGGIKEKALAALRLGVKRVIIPEENLKDLEDIPADQRKKLEFVPVKHVNQVLEIVLSRPLRVESKQRSSKIRPSLRARV